MSEFLQTDDSVVFNPTELERSKVNVTINKDSEPPLDVVSDKKWDQLVPGPIRERVEFKKYGFSGFYHPYVCAMIRELNRKGVEGLLKPVGDSADSKALLRQVAAGTFDFETTYQPGGQHVTRPFPVESFDFDHDGPFGIYNWELFFHIPLLIANRLSQNQKFEEAQQWYHYIFDPIQGNKKVDVDEEVTNSAARFWNVKPFFDEIKDENLDLVLQQISGGVSTFNQSLDEWTRNPFQPHAVARLRIVAYMKHTMIKYLDNLIAWADQLFARDSIESINEATQLYLLVSQILGKRPVEVEKGDFQAKTIDELLSGAIVSPRQLALETSLGELKTGNEAPEQQLNSLTSILLFCNPANDKILGYWDILEDRLFKIRNCQNIAGTTRSLALFQPPIDPALLVRANAAGLDLATVVNNSGNGNLSHYRFQFLIRKALELCADVKSLGAGLLSALEKKDAEELSLMRASQETTLLKAVRQVREQSIAESKEALDALGSAKSLAEQRLQFYSSRELMNSEEQRQLKKMERAIQLQLGSQATRILASALAAIPDAEVGSAGISSPFITFNKGGNNLYNAATGASEVLSTLSQIESFQASRSGILGSYHRRQDDWKLQSDLATTEVEQVEKQILGAEIRVAITEKDLENHDLQTRQAEEVAAFMKDKFTSKDLYSWMTTQLSTMYFRSYQLALEVARMAEQAFRYERAVENTSFIQFDHWDSLKKGLLSGERLERDLRRMEVSFIEQNKREYEISKNISLQQLSPQQLVNLKTRGFCDIYLPEVLFDLDHPGQYMRRIKSVNLTIPCVTGPYTNVNAKLTLLSNFTRKTTEVGNTYARQSDDNRFVANYGAIQSIA
ncbi:MAG: hypothetical protein AAFO69_01635, partial [Bacteroidota bacterium]